MQEKTNIISAEEKLLQEKMKRELRESAEKAKEGRIVAMRHTPDGAIPLRRVGGSDVDVPFPEEELSEDVHLSPQENDMMAVIYTAVMDIRKLKNRSIPLTRSELLNPSNKGGCTDLGFNKKVLRSLIKKGFLDSPEVDLLRTDKKSIGRRGLVYFTTKGRSYVRQYINKSYLPVWAEGSSGDSVRRRAGDERLASDGAEIQVPSEIHAPEKS